MVSIPTGSGIARALVVASFLAGSASAHSVWLERAPEGIFARFGEIEEGQRDTLKPGQSWNLARTSCGSDGPAPLARVGEDRVSLEGTCASPLVVHGGMPVHGKGKDAGRAIFAARFAPDSGLSLRVDSTLGLDLVPVAGVPGAVRVLRIGKPLAGHKVSILGPGKPTVEAVADADGIVRVPAGVAGGWTISSYVEEARSGVHGGAKFAKIWHVATITLERR